MTDPTRDEVAKLRQELVDTQETLRLCIEAVESIRERVWVLEQEWERIKNVRWSHAERK